MHSTVSRLFTAVSVGAVCTVIFAGCSSNPAYEAASVTEDVSSLFSADPSLLTPAVPHHYELQGEVQQTKRQSNLAPLENVASTVTCDMTIQDGVLVEAQILASLDGVNDLEFTLTDPVVIEFGDELKEQVIGVGTLTIDSSVYPHSRMLLEPTSRDGVMYLHATLAVPDSIVAETGIRPDSLFFSLRTPSEPAKQ